jgi:hypothetical protein
LLSFYFLLLATPMTKMTYLILCEIKLFSLFLIVKIRYRRISGLYVNLFDGFSVGSTAEIAVHNKDLQNTCSPPMLSS